MLGQVLNSNRPASREASWKLISVAINWIKVEIIFDDVVIFIIFFFFCLCCSVVVSHSFMTTNIDL